MAYEKMIKRTLQQAECENCGYREARDDHAPREMQCPLCGKWILFKEISWVGPDTFGK